jgi:hypothetical protein
MIKNKNSPSKKFHNSEIKLDDVENQLYYIGNECNEFDENNQNKLNETNNEYKDIIIKLSPSKSKKSNTFKKSKSYPNEIFLSNSKYTQNKLLEIELPNVKCNNFDNFSELNESDDLDIPNNSININCSLVKNKTYFEYFFGIANKYIHKTGLYKINKIEALNKFISIFLHVFIMVIFEIYFYFNYVVEIEQKSFLDKIDDYIKQIESNSPLTPEQKQIVKILFNQNSNNELLNYLYGQYINSIQSQKKLLHLLLIKACGMAGIIGIGLLILFLFGIANRKKIKWNWILIENLMMFVLLGIFEYLFFINIIMYYNPVTDEEVKYRAFHDIYFYLNSSSTN